MYLYIVSVMFLTRLNSWNRELKLQHFIFLNPSLFLIQYSRPLIFHKIQYWAEKNPFKPYPYKVNCVHFIFFYTGVVERLSRVSDPVGGPFRTWLRHWGRSCPSTRQGWDHRKPPGRAIESQVNWFHRVVINTHPFMRQFLNIYHKAEVVVKLSRYFLKNFLNRYETDWHRLLSDA